MQEYNTLQDIKDVINSVNNYYYIDKEYESHSDFTKAAENHFTDIVESFDNPSEYYNQFGLDYGDVHTNNVKVEQYWCSELNTVVSVYYYEAYIDSGVPAEDYYYGYVISY